MFSVKLHKHPSGNVLAVCDSEILGMSFSEGEIRIKVGEGFYGGVTVEEEELLQYMAAASNMNLVGERVILLAIREGYVDKDRVLTIGGTKHAQVLR